MNGFLKFAVTAVRLDKDRGIGSNGPLTVAEVIAAASMGIDEGRKHLETLKGMGVAYWPGPPRRDHFLLELGAEDIIRGLLRRSSHSLRQM